MVVNLLILLLWLFYFPANSLPPQGTVIGLSTEAPPEATVSYAGTLYSADTFSSATVPSFIAVPHPSNMSSFSDTFFQKGKLLYENTFRSQEKLMDWVMEGPGILQFNKGWMKMFSPDKEWDHVLWCPEDFPSSFIAEWEMQNLDTSEGLTIVFFAAKGSGGEDIFDAVLLKRDGTFKHYNKGQINCYHISYYTNNPKNSTREKSHLRKDPMFALLQKGETGIPANSLKKHKIRLIKKEARIVMYVDNRKILDYQDEDGAYGPVYLSGKIGFRQMRWSHFRYRDFRVWDIKTDKL